MAKTVVIISSSPRRGGNSDSLCDRFAQGALEGGHHVEKIRLGELKIGYCAGCYACAKTGRCVQNDDARPVLDRMMAADVIVLATPVYFYTVCAQLKTLIDRSVVIYPKLTNKTFYYIMAMEEKVAKFEGTLAALRGFLDCCEGSAEAGYIGATGVFEKGAAQNTPFWNDAYRLGRDLK